MANSRLLNRLKRRWLAARTRRTAGFTLIELLVSIIIGSIITVALLLLVVQLTNVNQRDTARSETQRDMQAAMDYIVQDLREAVYVYDGDCLDGAGSTASFGSYCPGVVNHIPESIVNNSMPVLAFWRADPLPPGLIAKCRAGADSLGTNSVDTDIQGVPCLSGKTYSLVVYSLKRGAANDPIWKGRARITRYQLSQFQSDADDGSDTVPGYVDPISDAGAKFWQWPYRSTGGAPTSAQSARPTNTEAELVDFVDDTPVDQLPGDQPTCPDSNKPTGSLDRVTITPRTFRGGLTTRGFYACVRGQTYTAISNTSLSSEQDVNQEVLVSLSGNVAGRSGFPFDLPLSQRAVDDVASEVRLLPIQSRVLIRGIINKSGATSNNSTPTP